MEPNAEKNERKSDDTSTGPEREYRPRSFSKYIYITFFWCMVGVSIIYGVRFWHDQPPHPSFVPIIGAVFAAVLSFTLVIALEYVIGPISIKFGEKFNFTGASGPIILWCICFLIIVFGLYLLGLTDVAANKSNYDHQPCSLGDMMLRDCPLPVKDPATPTPG